MLDVIDMKCAFMDRECDNNCVAHVSTDVTTEAQKKQFYHFAFPCIRLDAMYDIAGVLVKIKELLECKKQLYVIYFLK